MCVSVSSLRGAEVAPVGLYGGPYVFDWEGARAERGSDECLSVSVSAISLTCVRVLALPLIS